MTYVLRNGELVEGTGNVDKRCVTSCAKNSDRHQSTASACTVCTGQARRHNKGGCRVADGTMSMDEAYTRHRQLLKRQHFGREPPNVKKFF